MGDNLKFAISSLDEKFSTNIELIEKKLKYQVDGFKQTLEARISKFLDQSQVGENSMAHYTQMVHDEVDSLRKQGEDMQMILKERVLTLE